MRRSAMVEDDSFQADGKTEGVLYGFLTKGANISIGGGFRGQTLGVEAGCDNGPAMNAAATNPNDGGVIVSNNGGGPGSFCPGLKVSSTYGDGIAATGGSNGVHGRSESPNDSGLWGENGSSGFGVAGSSTAVGVGVVGKLDNGTTLEGNGRPPGGVGVWGTAVITSEPVGDGVLGEGVNGVHGRSKSPTDSGVWGENTNGGYGVAGASAGIGVFGGVPGSSGLSGKPSVVGIWGTAVVPGSPADAAEGILGEGKNGVHGRSRSPTDSGVWGENTNGGYGVVGSSTGIGVFGGVPGSSGMSGKPSVVGIWGTAVVPGSPTDSADGILGEGRNGVHGRSRSPTDSGVWGENRRGGVGVAGSSATGYGGQFTGGFAQLYLTPSATIGHPTSGNHKRGEFYVDSHGSLFFCNADGVPGNWVRLA
jgi:hypothetical protein